jgi:hypothetical protein
MRPNKMGKNKIIISASRRTDIPCFYMDWFMKRIEAGFFKVSNPYNNKIYIVPAYPDKVHTIVFWSKNFRYFLKNNFGEKLKKKGFNIFFNFTINSNSEILEPNAPNLKEKIMQIKEIALRFGEKTINWRFDPICFYLFENKRRHNLADFVYLSEKIAKLKISRCITSFMDIYPKIKKFSAISDCYFIDIKLKEKIKILLKMEKLLSDLNILLFLCSEKEIIDALPKISKIAPSSCISAEYLMKIFGRHLSLKKDAGQRKNAGCLCSISSDIGSYKLQPCGNKCLYCYANPVR